METRVQKFDFRAFKREPKLRQLASGPWHPTACVKFQEICQNLRKTSAPSGRLYKGLRGKINLGQMAWKQACRNLISENFSGKQMLGQLA